MCVYSSTPLFVLCMFPSLRPERKAKNSVEVGNHNASKQVLYSMWRHRAESQREKPCDHLTFYPPQPALRLWSSASSVIINMVFLKHFY